MKLPSIFLLFLASPVFSYGHGRPVPPTLTFLFSANLTLGTPIDIGLTPFGEKLIIPVTDGAFSGPKLEGKHKYPTTFSSTWRRVEN